MDEKQQVQDQSKHDLDRGICDAYVFDDFSFDAQKLELKRGGNLVAIKFQPAKLLKLLLEKHPETVLRNDIFETLWDDGTTVEFDQNLNACVRQLRSILSDSATNPKYIETLPKRGYRFVGDLKTGKAVQGKKVWWSWRKGVAAAAVVVVGLLGGVQMATNLEARPKQVQSLQKIYVPPIAIEFDNSEMENGLVQYGLRLGVIEQLATTNNESFVVVNGETLWADGVSFGSENEKIHRLIIELDRFESDYAVVAKLVSPGSFAPQSSSEIRLNTISAAEISRVSQSVAEWAIVQLGLRPLPRSTPSLHRSAEYFDAIVKAKRARQIGSPRHLKESLVWGEEALRASPSSVEAKGTIALALVAIAGTDDEYPYVETYSRALEYVADIRSTHGVTMESELAAGYVALYHEWDLKKAREYFDIAKELAPTDPLVRSWGAGLLAAEGDIQAAAKEIDAAVQMDPLSMAISSDRCWYLSAAKRFDEAVTACRWAIELAPDQNWSVVGLVAALESLGRDNEAIELYRPLAIQLVQKESAARQIAEPKLEISDLVTAHCIFAEWLTPRAERGDFPSFDLAAFYAQCGNFEKAEALLALAKERGESGMLFLRHDPRFEGFRGTRSISHLTVANYTRQAVR